MAPEWLDWARRLGALAQTGLEFAENPYDIERYTAIRTIAAEMSLSSSLARPGHHSAVEEPGDDRKTDLRTIAGDAHHRLRLDAVADLVSVVSARFEAGHPVDECRFLRASDLGAALPGRFPRIVEAVSGSH